MGKSGSGISHMREKFAPTHRSRNTAHAQWLQTHCQWYPTGDVRTHNSRTDSRRIFKLGGGVDNMTRHVWPLTKVKRSKVKVTRSRNVSAAIKLVQRLGKSRSRISNMREKFAPTHRLRDRAHAQWLQTHLVTLSFRLNQVLNSVLNQGTGYGSVQMAPGYCPKY